MREIKFRAKTRQIHFPSKWVYGYYYYDEVLQDHVITSSSSEKGVKTDWGIDPETLGQYIGRKDKNGVEIFEGDVVDANFERQEDFDPNCYEGEGSWRGIITYKGSGYIIKRDGYSPSCSNYDIIEFEVIGNIYENPELQNEY